jgi:hypothetical protein
MQLRVEINYKGAIRPLINQPIVIKLLSLYKSHPGHQLQRGEQHTDIQRERNDLREREAITVKREEKLSVFYLIF